MATSALPPAARTGCSMPTPAISPGSNSCSTSCSRCCSAPICATTIPALTVDLTNPDIYRQGRIVLPKDMLHIVRTIFLWRGTAYQRIGVQNHGDRPASFDLTLLFDNDFADLFEVRGEKRPRRGIGTSKLLGPADVLLEYRGLDDAVRATALHFDPRPTRLAVNAATYHFDLAPQQVDLAVRGGVLQQAGRVQRRRAFFRGLLAHRREMRRSTAGAASIETSNNIFNEVLCQAMADLNMLMTETPQGRYPYAGIPWYSTTFGRDGIITALQMLWVDPRVARGVLRRLAFYQAKSVDPLADAEPGKILHEMRGGEMAALREVPFALILRQRRCDAAVRAAGRSLCRAHRRRRNARANCGRRSRRRCGWIDGPGDPDRDGFVEYQRAHPSRGLPIRAGRIPTTRSSMPTAGWPKATSRSPKCRATSSPPSGWRRAARLRLGIAREGGAACDRSASARGAVRAGLLVRGTRHLCARARWRRSSRARCAPRTRASCCSPASSRDDRARLVAADLMRPHFFTGWGIRTVAHGEARYNPMSYHNGSIWPHDNALIALGFARYGLKHSVGASVQGRCSTPPPIWTCGGCPSCSAAFGARSGAGRRSIRSPARRRPGPARRRSRCWKPRSGSNSTPRAAKSGCAIRACRPSSTRWCCATCGWGPPASICGSRRHGDEVSLEVLRTRGQIQVSIVLAH